MPYRINSLLSGVSRTALGAAFSLTLLVAPAAAGEPKAFNIPVQEATTAIRVFGQQAGIQVLATVDDLRGKRVNAVVGKLDVQDALRQMLVGTGLTFRATDANTILIEKPRNTASVAPESSAQGSTPGQAPDEVAQGQQETKAQADDQAGKERVEKVTVTGSRIRGNARGASPVIVIDKDDIDKSGYSSTRDVMQSLPQNHGSGQNEFSNNIPGNGGDVSLGSSVNLRGLGSSSTVTLLNGHRLAYTSFLPVTDISLIPLSAVERVEVLTDGASAIYGADAIAGVVNIILRDDYDGAETVLNYGGTATRGSLQEKRVAQTFGRAWESGNALFTYEYYERDPLSAADRSYSSTATLPYDLLYDQQRHSALAVGSVDILPNLSIFGHALFSRQEQTSRENFGLVVITDVAVEQIGTVLGMKWDLNENWQLEASGTFSENDIEQDAALGLPVFDKQFSSYATSYKSLDAQVEGDLMSLPGGSAKIAAGMAYQFQDQKANFASRIARDVKSAFAELFIPVVSSANAVAGVERLELTLAGRYDDYSDFGDSTNPKVGLVWSPFSDISLRGTWGTSFRVPTLSNTIQNETVFLRVLSDPIALDGNSLTLIRFGSNPDLQPETSTAWTVGIDYEPAALPGFIARGTLFEVDFRDRIQRPTDALFGILLDPALASVVNRGPTAAEAAAVVAGANRFNNLFGPFLPSDVEVIADNRLQNIASSIVRGVDFNFTYGFETEYGSFDATANVSYLIDIGKQITAAAPVRELVDTVFNPVDLRVRGGVSWKDGPASAAAFVNYTDGYVNEFSTPDEKVGSWTTLDLTFTYEFNLGDAETESGKTRITLAVQNVFDEDPPFVSTAPFTTGVQFGYDPTNADPQGRFVSLRLVQAW